MTPLQRQALESAGWKFTNDPEEFLTDVMGPAPLSPDREAIRKRREACMRSRTAIQVEFYRQMQSNLICLEYVQAECLHPITDKTFQISHFTESCVDCQKAL
jgi:hypothetical protein